ncbi:basic leucine zipper 34-like [Gossypium australe]|uniref:Basic leucine zipper 34-like n=1 Tax=Gossypium australe TaxID=47621 RepID=A0A5B6X122_9ROSI|nr:basic leucine zipper 34-like [Gossypium australe]
MVGILRCGVVVLGWMGRVRIVRMDGWNADFYRKIGMCSALQADGSSQLSLVGKIHRLREKFWSVRCRYVPSEAKRVADLLPKKRLQVQATTELYIIDEVREKLEIDKIGPPYIR